MSVSTWSTTDALNVVSGGVSGSGGANIDEGCPPSGINNAIRHIMAQVATFVAAPAFTGDLTLTSTDAGAAAGPVINLHRNSATPAASDIVGKLNFQGEDSGSAVTDYASIQAVLTDVTNGSEDATLQFINMVAGTARATFSISAGTGTLTSFDDGAGAGPTLQLHRNSATPAAADILGLLSFVGQDSAANGHTYASFYGVLDDPTNGSEDGSVGLQLSIAGSLVETALFGPNGLTLSSTDAGAGVGPILTLHRNSATPAASDTIGQIKFNGEDAGSAETIYADMFVTLVDPTDASEDGTITHRVSVAGTLTNRAVFNAAGVTLGGALTATGGGSLTGTWSDHGTVTTMDLNGGTIDGTVIGGASAAACTVTTLQANSTSYLAGTTRIGQNTTDTPGSGNNTAGSAINAVGQAFFSSASTSLIVNRTADGQLASFHSGGTSQGTISIAGATTTYATFFGSHWAQLADGSRPDILRGTIVESLDQMASWPGEINEHLPCFKISDTPGSKKVYGIFAWWDNEPGPTNDAFIGALGADRIRIRPGEVVEIGDLIESNGDGCGRVQKDDHMRASTVARVTSRQIIDQYEDGSFTVPATIHCG